MSPTTEPGCIEGKFSVYNLRSSSSISEAKTQVCPSDDSARWKPPSPAKRSTNRSDGSLGADTHLLLASRHNGLDPERRRRRTLVLPHPQREPSSGSETLVDLAIP